MHKIIVKNIPESIEKDTLYSIFGKHASIIDVIWSETRRSVFISYASKEECDTVIRHTNGSSIKDLILLVEYAYDRDNKLFVFNLPVQTTIEELSLFFSYYGDIFILKFIKNVLLIVYKDKRDTQRVLNLSNKISFKSNRLLIKQTNKIEIKRDDLKCVFVYNIPEEVTELDFNSMFSKFGNVVSSGIKGHGRGFINYENDVGALKAVKYMDGKKVKSKKLRCIIKGGRQQR